MKNIRIWLVLVSAVAFESYAFGGEKATNYSFSTNFSDGYMSGNGAVFLREPVIQSSIYRQFPNHFYGSVWWSVGLDDADLSSNYGDEVDYTVGWSGPIGDGFTLDARLAYWDIYGLLSEEPADVLGAMMTLSKQLAPNLGASFSIDRYVPTDSSVFGGGTRYTLGLSYSQKFDDRGSFSFSPGIVYEDGIFGLDQGFNATVSAALNWQVGDANVSFPKATVAIPITDFSDGRKVESVYGGGLSFAF